MIALDTHVVAWLQTSFLGLNVLLILTNIPASDNNVRHDHNDS